MHIQNDAFRVLQPCGLSNAGNCNPCRNRRIATSNNGSDKAYVGVIAQEVQAVMPQVVARAIGRVI